MPDVIRGTLSKYGHKQTRFTRGVRVKISFYPQPYSLAFPPFFGSFLVVADNVISVIARCAICANGFSLIAAKLDVGKKKQIH